MTAYNRGQILYRVAEMLEARTREFADLTGDDAEVHAAVDRFVWYAGWADKLAQVLGSANPVAGPYFNFTIPEPTGVVGILVPDEPALEGLVSRLPPANAGGERGGDGGRRSPPRPASARRGRAGRGAGDGGRSRRGREHPDGPPQGARPLAGR